MTERLTDGRLRVIVANGVIRDEEIEPVVTELQTLRAERTGALADVVAERRRQIEVEGWTPEHDDAHDDGSLALAASCYAAGLDMPEETREYHNVTLSRFRLPVLWPRSWAPCWWKLRDPRRNLVRSGALILAEIERLDRAALQQGRTGQ